MSLILLMKQEKSKQNKTIKISEGKILHLLLQNKTKEKKPILLFFKLYYFDPCLFVCLFIYY